MTARYTWVRAPLVIRFMVMAVFKENKAFLQNKYTQINLFKLLTFFSTGSFELFGNEFGSIPR